MVQQPKNFIENRGEMLLLFLYFTALSSRFKSASDVYLLSWEAVKYFFNIFIHPPILESWKFYQKNNSSIWIYGIFKLPHLRKIQTPRKELFHVWVYHTFQWFTIRLWWILLKLFYAALNPVSPGKLPSAGLLPLRSVLCSVPINLDLLLLSVTLPSARVLMIPCYIFSGHPPGRWKIYADAGFQPSWIMHPFTGKAASMSL